MSFMEVANNFFAAESAQTTASWFMMSSPLPTVTIFSFYILFVKIIGPKLMKNSMPCELKKTLTLYNLTQIICNGSLIFILIQSNWLTHYSSGCRSNESLVFHAGMTIACWLYFLLKFLDMFESLFLIVDKRSDEISFTSLLYESFVLLSVWFIVRFIPGGHVSILMLVDTSTHVFKHLYYLVTQKKPIAASKILLALHLMQSVIIFMHVLELLAWNRCDFPTPFIGLLSIQSVLLFLLFRSKCKRTEHNIVNSKGTKKDIKDDYKSNSTTVSFYNYRPNNNSEVKQRYITTLKAQV